MERPQLLSSQDLHQKLQSLIQQERKITNEILQHIHEVDQRKLYLKMAYPSLFDYLVKAHGYSEASAMRRIDAARMMVAVPDLGQQIESGIVSLNQISKVQQAIRQAKKFHGVVVRTSVKKQILAKIQKKSARETEQILAQEFQLPVSKNDSIKMQKDESVRLELTFTKEQMQKLEMAKRSSEHKLAKAGAGSDWASFFLFLAERVVDAKPSTQSVSKALVRPSTSAMKVRGQIFARDQVCQFKDPHSGKVCGSHYYLEVDHIQPRWAQGGNEPANLRVLCSAHNKYRYQVGR